MTVFSGQLLLPLMVALPLLGFAVLVLGGSRLSRSLAGLIGVGGVGLSALIALLLSVPFVSNSRATMPIRVDVWQWFNVSGMEVPFTLYLDALSLLMVLVVTCIGFLIHLYSAQFMAEDESFSRYFAYLNLFVASMLILVLAGNFAVLILGWEGVGLCSYLLIGFWYRDAANGRAARKAFVVTRIGDASLLLGVFLIFHGIGTIDIQTVMTLVPYQWPVGSALAALAALLLCGGAVGKSAQIPLQVWLPDAMAGPTPVSALIHAATMVTAGVYLLARCNALFSLAPDVQLLVAAVGALTMLLAGFSALVQWDIKRVLAYSTISQLGLMFLGLGFGAWTAAMFHFFTHAFFKALLFLGAGVIIYALHHETDMRKMGGLRHWMPLTFWTFLAGAAALSALPLISAGFYSKDAVLLATFGSGESIGLWFWLVGAFSAFLTALYTFRMVYLTFFGELRQAPSAAPDWRMSVPLVILAAGSLVAGLIELPATLGGRHSLSGFLSPVLPVSPVHVEHTTELGLQLATSLLALFGLVVAWFVYQRPGWLKQGVERGPVGALRSLLFSGWGFDWIYQTFIVRPYQWFARVNAGDAVDSLVQSVASYAAEANGLLSAWQDGRVRWYVVGTAAGVAILALIAVTGGPA